MSTRWQPQPGAPGPGSSGRVGPGGPGQGPTTGGVGGSSSGGPVNPEVQAIIKLVRTDPDFRNELKSVIAEALQADMGKLKSELMGQMSGNNAAAASSHVPPPMDYLSIIQRDFPGASLEEWSHNDEAGSVYGFAETVTSHIIKQNNMTYLCDIKEVRIPPLSSPSSILF